MFEVRAFASSNALFSASWQIERRPDLINTNSSECKLRNKDVFIEEVPVKQFLQG